MPLYPQLPQNPVWSRWILDRHAETGQRASLINILKLRPHNRRGKLDKIVKCVTDHNNVQSRTFFSKIEGKPVQWF
jgi:hypothetical protein